MSQPYALADILLAAGGSRRFNGNKLAAIDPVSYSSLFELACMRTQTLSLQQSIVVGGCYLEWLQNHLPSRYQLIAAHHWQQGISASIQAGLGALASNITHVLIHLADQIAVDSHALTALIMQSKQAPDKIIASEYNSIVGAPVLFPIELLPEPDYLSGDRGAGSWLRVIQQTRPECIIHVKLPEAAIDIDTQQDLLSWQQRL